jgi:RNA polymerase primary sigma factor
MEEELSEKEQFVFVHRYGLEDEEEKTLEDVGEEMDLTRERVRQIQESALEKVRNSRLGEELREFLFSLTQ